MKFVQKETQRAVQALLALACGLMLLGAAVPGCWALN